MGFFTCFSIYFPIFFWKNKNVYFKREMKQEKNVGKVSAGEAGEKS